MKTLISSMNLGKVGKAKKNLCALAPQCFYSGGVEGAWVFDSTLPNLPNPVASVSSIAGPSGKNHRVRDGEKEAR